jgi:uncharacterized protein (DUF2235 family)
MPKNVVICCDGTANEFAADKTNVIKLFSTLVQDPARQVTYYHPGIGTMEPTGPLMPVRRQIATVIALAFGYGLERDIQDGYVFLMRNFEPGDRVFLFGFSRGAYTVRAIASLLHMYGVIRHDNESFVPYAIRMLLAIHRSALSANQRARARDYFALARDFRQTMSSTACNPWFVGVWDTVSSVGWIENPLHLPYVSNNPDIEVGRHAVAIDERRAFFRTELFRPSVDPAKPGGPKDLLQVWFPGVHCDVGGGYPEAESGISKIALGWMLDQAKAHGLLVHSEREDLIMGRIAGTSYAAPDVNGPIHESLTGVWNLAEYLPKRQYDWTTGAVHRHANQGRRRYVAPGSFVHSSAFARAGEYARRLPPGVISRA